MGFIWYPHSFKEDKVNYYTPLWEAKCSPNPQPETPTFQDLYPGCFTSEGRFQTKLSGKVPGWGERWGRDGGK